MAEEESWFADASEYTFTYAPILKLIFWVASAMMLLLPGYEFMAGKVAGEELAALAIFIFGFVCLHIAWRCMGVVTISESGVRHTRFGRETFIPYDEISEINNRPVLMSLRIVGDGAMIYIEKQINDYDLAYELLREKVPQKLEPDADDPVELPVVVRTALNHFYFLIFLLVAGAAVLGWQGWQFFAHQAAIDYAVAGLAGGAILFSIVFTAIMYLRVEFWPRGIVIAGLWHRNEIECNQIVHFLLNREYEKEADPTYDLTIEYTSMPVDEAPDDAPVYTQTIPGSLMDRQLEPIFDHVVSVYGLN